MELSRRSFLGASLAGAAVLPSVASPAARVAVPSSKAELPYLNISDAAGLLKGKEISPVELTQAILDRIEQIDSRIHAFITVAGDQALQAARRAEQEIVAGKYRGPLHGIPVGVKDTHYTKGIKTTAGSPALSDFIPSFDSTVVARLKQAGAVLVGKTNLPEFSMGGNTPSFNPWDLSRTPGGSSGGSAAALAARMLTGATGGDTSSSIRHPSTLCGVVGMKPTYGRVSRYGIAVISWSLDHVGPMTRTVEDNALMLNVLAGRDPMDDTSADFPVPDYTRSLRAGVKGIRIGIPKAFLLEGYHPDVVKAYREALEVFTRLGAKVTEVDMPPTLEPMNRGQRIIRICEAASYHELLAARRERYALEAPGRDSGRPRQEAEIGSMYTAVQYLRAQRLRKVFLKEITAVFQTFDVFVTPGKPAPAGEPASVQEDFLSMFNCAGFPAIAVPSGFSTSPSGLPVGLQIVAKPFEEETIYRAAYAYESQTRWYEKRPSL